jgi:hypothetical protein
MRADLPRLASGVLQAGYRHDDVVDLCALVARAFGVELTLEEGAALDGLIRGSPAGGHPGRRCQPCGAGRGRAKQAGASRRARRPGRPATTRTPGRSPPSARRGRPGA